MIFIYLFIFICLLTICRALFVQNEKADILPPQNPLPTIFSAPAMRQYEPFPRVLVSMIHRGTALSSHSRGGVGTCGRLPALLFFSKNGNVANTTEQCEALSEAFSERASREPSLPKTERLYDRHSTLFNTLGTATYLPSIKRERR